MVALQEEVVVGNLVAPAPWAFAREGALRWPWLTGLQRLGETLWRSILEGGRRRKRSSSMPMSAVEKQIQTVSAQAARTLLGRRSMSATLQRGCGRPQYGFRAGCGGLDRCIAANLRASFLSFEGYAIPHMLGTECSIVHTSSVTGVSGVRNRAAYSATKGAIVALTRNMALDYARFSHSCELRLSRVHTNATARCPARPDPEKAARLEKLHPLGRLGTPEDIASAVLFLASADASWITGQALAVDGGFSVGVAEDI